MWTFPTPKCIEQFSVSIAPQLQKGKEGGTRKLLHNCPILQSDSWGTAEIDGTTYHSSHSFCVQEYLSLSPESLHRMTGRGQPAQAGFSSSPSLRAGSRSQEAVLVYRALGHHTLSYLLTDHGLQSYWFFIKINKINQT